jgi:iron complex outermembrane recepter protein
MYLPKNVLKNSVALTLASCSLLAHADQDTDQLPRVVITATRTATDIMSVPTSINRIDADEIALIGSTHHSDILNRVPGAHFQRNSGQESLTALRSPVLAGAGTCGSFLFLENSIPIRPVGFCNVNELFEVNMSQAYAVEVQRGPAGVMYGSSAMHGAVNVISRDPMNSPVLAMGVTGGESKYLKGDIEASHRTDQVGIYAGVVAEHDGGWRDDSAVNHIKSTLGYSQAFASSVFEAKLTHITLNQNTAGFAQGFEAYRDPIIARSNPNPEAYRNAYATRLNTHWHKPLSDSTDLDIRPYARNSHMEFIQHFLPGTPIEENGQTSAGMISSLLHRFDSGAQLLTGIDLEYADSFLIETQYSPTAGARPFGKHYDYNVISNVAALYGRFEQPFATQWNLSVGVRGEYVSYDYNNRMIDGSTRDDGVACTPACVYRRPADTKETFTNVTPTLGLSWRWHPQHMIYSNVTRGYRAPEITELYRLQRQQASASLDSEFIDSIELGTRGTIAILDYSIAAFGMRKENVIFRDSASFNVSNGKTKHRGVEYEFSWLLDDPLRISFGGTWAKHTYDFDALAESGEIIKRDNFVDTAPENIWNARALWTIAPQLNTEFEWQHVSGYYTDAANLHHYSGHNIVNWRAQWHISDSWQVIARVMNIMDRAYADRADYSSLGTGIDRYFPGRGRTAFVEFRWKLD